MQRLFSTFPGGMPGVALLLLRVVFGGMLVMVCARSLAVADGGWRAVAAGIVAGVSGLAVLLGLVTPFVAIAGVVAIAAAPHTWGSDGANLLPGQLAMVLVVVIGLALALLGPGAFSLDCRLFGRREISFPPDPERKQP
jgi:hypothetical protein